MNDSTTATTVEEVARIRCRASSWQPWTTLQVLEVRESPGRRLDGREARKLGRAQTETDRAPRAVPHAGRPEPEALDERRFIPPNIEALPSASEARRRSYRGSEV